ncbi:hypothetical protein [Mangrovibacterium sp.]|uniref:hypothetical protein n=1 Tax=Mangrovibacterium sp. TaxID=1961364 RepID=UPI00356B6012
MKLLISTMLLLIGLTSCTSQSEKKELNDESLTELELIERGRYLVSSIGCDDCHSPKMMTDQGLIPDPATRFAGHIEGDLTAKVNNDALADWALFNLSFTAAVGPWGISYAGNISSDDSGIGTWTEEQFVMAMREGQFKGLAGTRKLLPPMPWQNYANLSDEDLKAMYTYLKSTKPIRNVVPPPVSPEELFK